MVREIKHSPQLEISWCVYHPLRRALFNICKLIHFGPVISFYKFEWITGESVIRDTLSYQNTMLSTCDFLNSFLKKISKQQKTTTRYKLGHFMTCSKKSVRMLCFFFSQGHVVCQNLILSRQGFIFCPLCPKKFTYKKRRYLYNQAPYCSSFISCYDNLSLNDLWYYKE